MASKGLFVLVTCFVLVTVVVSVETLRVSFTMSEDENVGYNVGNILDQIQDQVNVSTGQSIQFSITEDVSNMFTLNDVTGNLYTQVMIDRDEQPGCKYRKECVINFNVGLLIGTVFWEIEVSVYVLDVNDNDPEFQKPIKTLPIMEDVAMNTSFVIENAIDLDMGDGNGIQSYTMTTQSDTFGFRAAKDNDVFVLELFVKKALDRENTTSYRLQIVAQDGGSPVRSGTLTVNIEVKDKNDNAPDFSREVYNVSVSEDSTPGTVFLTLSATDRDAGVNAKVFYRIKQNQADLATISDIFDVDSSTGHVSTRSVLQYREGLFYTFDVEAFDHGEPARDSQATVHVYVLDAGNNAPTIAFSSFSPRIGELIILPENSPNNTFIAHLKVEDTDSGPSGQVSCVVSDNRFLISSTSQTGHKVSVVTPLDRETQDRYEVVVTCADAAPVPLSASMTLSISVSDTNDNTPVFGASDKQVSVYENTDMEVTIAQVSATDRDAGNNSKLTYQIIGHDKIHVDPNNGIIKVVSAFDREVTPEVIFEVLAIDQGIPPLTGTTTISLEIKDRNDNPPRFSSTLYIFIVQENMASSTVVGQLSATDRDTGDNAKVSFAMAEQSSSSSTIIPFIVFSNGLIKTNQELNRETQNRYDFTVIVKDQGSPSQNSTVHVTVNIGDENDNTPVFGFPSDTNRTVSVLYPNQSITHVTQILAYDFDSGENRTLQYSIKDGNKFGMFEMDTNTGLVSFSRQDAPIDSDESVTLLIEVKDMGKPSLSSTAVLIVQLIYSNATMLPLTDGGNKLIIISVVVVVITVVISAGIIAVIFVLRFCDAKKRQMEARNCSDSDCGFESKPSMYIVKPLEDQNSILESSIGGKKKKEVSFSLEEGDSVNRYLHLRVTNIPDHEKQMALDQVSNVSELTKKETLMQNLKLNQLLLESKNKQKQTVVHRPEDSHSETSGETTQSDSGRGGSEEDVPSNSPSADDPRTFDLHRAPRNNDLPNQFLSHNLSMNTSRGDNSSPKPPPVPSRTYKAHSSFSDGQKCYQELSAPQYYSPRASGEVPFVDVASLSWEHHYPIPQQPVDFCDLESYSPQYRDSLKSRDDDDCSTTTSGSYTIYSEDML